MEFWGVEVKAGEPLSVCPDDGQLIHISQVALGEVKNMKAANYVPIRLKVNGKKFVIGTLSAEREPQITFDLVLEKEFELSHDWKDGSIYFCGYTADEQDDGLVGHDFSDEDDEDEEEEIMLENGKPDVQVAKPKSKAASAKPKVTLVEPKKAESDDSDESDDIDDESDDDLEDDSDDDMSEDEETPKKVDQTKKRPSDSAIKTPASTKKAKTGTPQKTDGKKGSAHTATPHPAKKSEKKTTEPKSSGSASCKTCSKTFSSEKGLESHSKAKHGGK